MLLLLHYTIVYYTSYVSFSYSTQTSSKIKTDRLENSSDSHRESRTFGFTAVAPALKELFDSLGDTFIRFLYKKDDITDSTLISVEQAVSLD